MKFIVDNVQTKMVVGGSDYLCKVEFLKELRLYMRERPKGYGYAPSYREHKWDGFSYFITNSGAFATGFLPQVISYVKELSPAVEIEIIDNRSNVPEFLSDADFCDDLGNGIVMRDYQSNVVRKVRDSMVSVDGKSWHFHRGVIDVATNGGKTVIMAGLIMNIKKPKVLILIDRKMIFNQMLKFFSQFWQIGAVAEGDIDFKDVTVCMAKTLHNAMSSLNVQKKLREYNVVIIDEGHKAHSDTYKAIMKNIDAGCRLIMSGTPLDMDDKVDKMVILGLTGRRLVKITNDELIKAGVSQQPIVHIHLIQDAKVMMAGGSYEGQMDELYKSSILLDKVVELIGEQDKYSLVTFQFKKHGEFIYDYLRKRGIECEWTHGQDPERFEKVERFSKGGFGTLIASMILKEGVNIPNIQRLIRLEFGKSKITNKQVVGRAIRTDGVSMSVEVHDFYVDGKYSGNHSVKRLGTYRNEGFEIKYDYENKNGRPLRTVVHLPTMKVENF